MRISELLDKYQSILAYIQAVDLSALSDDDKQGLNNIVEILLNNNENFMSNVKSWIDSLWYNSTAMESHISLAADIIEEKFKQDNFGDSEKNELTMKFASCFLDVNKATAIVNTVKDCSKKVNDQELLDQVVEGNRDAAIKLLYDARINSNLDQVIEKIGSVRKLDVQNINSIKQVTKFLLSSGGGKGYTTDAWYYNLSELLLTKDQGILFDVLTVVKAYEATNAPILTDMSKNTATIDLASGMASTRGSDFLTQTMHASSFKCNILFLKSISAEHLDKLKEFAPAALAKKTYLFRDVEVLHNFIKNGVFTNVEQFNKMSFPENVNLITQKAMQSDDQQYFKMLKFVVFNGYATLEHFLQNGLFLDALKALDNAGLFEMAAVHLKSTLINTDKTEWMTVFENSHQTSPKINEMGMMEALTTYGMRIIKAKDEIEGKVLVEAMRSEFNKTIDVLSSEQNATQAEETAIIAPIEHAVDVITQEKVTATGCCKKYCEIM